MNTKEIKKKLPRRFYIISRKLKIYLDKIKFTIFIFFNYIVFFLPNLYLKSKKIYLIVKPSTSIGDLLILTPLVDIKEKNFSVYLIHQNKEVFENLGNNQKYFKKNFFNNLLIQFMSASHFSNIIGDSFGTVKNKMHLRDQLLYNKKEFYKLTKNISRNVVVKFSNEELNSFKKKFSGLIKNNYGVMLSENNYSGHSQVKNWGWKNMQKIVDETGKMIKWVQVGMSYDKKLNGVMDFRGKTNIRELFYVVSKSKIIVTTEGMLTHLSSAFNIPCITIYPGFLDKELSMYKNIIPIVHKPKMECSPCWKAVCKFNGKPPCLEKINPKKVIKEVQRIVRK